MSTKRRLVPTELAAFALGVPQGTVRQWGFRGKLTRYGTKQSALWDLDECARLAKLIAEQGNTRGASCQKIAQL